MIRQIRIELLKLRTTRLSYGLLATGAAITAMFAILEATQAGKGGANSPEPLYTFSGFTHVVSAGIWELMFAMVLGVTVTTSEFRHQTATLTYLASPHRNRVLAAKTAAGAAAGGLFGLVAFLVGGGTALGFTVARGYHVPLGDATMARIGIGHLVAGALLAAIGVGLGAVLKSQLAGIIGVFVWAIIIESLIGGVFTATRPYLPYTAATNLAGTPLGGASFGPANGTGGPAPLPFAAAMALLAALIVVVAAIASATTVRRDIS
jgi:ABC-type transport system involved in multi-copper enzyme maturation permease subunit